MIVKNISNTCFKSNRNTHPTDQQFEADQPNVFIAFELFLGLLKN